MKNIGVSLISFILFFGLIFTLSSCDSSNEPSDSGSLLVKVTDDPFPIDYVESATVTVNKIEVRRKDVSDGDPFHVVSEEQIDFDLLALRNGVTASLPEINIEAGNYDLVRLYVEEASLILKEGMGEFTVKVPSGDETGIKIFIDPELQIQGGLTAELLLDFDLSNSFLLQGNISSPADIKSFHFQPVIRAVNNQLAGAIYGTVTDSEGGTLEGVLITVTYDGESATALTDENGYYQIIGLKEADYSVTASLEGYLEEIADGVTVTADQKTEQNFVLTM